MNNQITRQEARSFLKSTETDFISNKSTMKIGILTYHHIDNYGATLQAYALYKFLKQQNHDVEIIDYRHYKAAINYSKSLVPINKHYTIKKKAFSNIVRAWKMRKFLLNNVNLSRKKIYLKKGLEYFRDKYDVVICGSDQIWCINSIRGFDTSYFLDFVSEKNTRKISYAASCGDLKSLNSYQEKVSSLIQEFHTVLVRDSNSQNIIETECNKDAKVVLDPTFLIDYKELINSVPIKEKYLLIYNYAAFSNTQEELVKSIAKAKGLTIVAVGKYNRLADKNLVGVSPEEWISLFNQASYVVTNTFHGTIFAIISQKPFTVFANANKKIKVTDLLSQFNLENRIFTESLSIEQINEQLADIDYKSVSENLSSKIIESQNYLLKAITAETTNLKN